MLEIYECTVVNASEIEADQLCLNLPQRLSGQIALLAGQDPNDFSFCSEGEHLAMVAREIFAARLSNDLPVTGVATLV